MNDPTAEALPPRPLQTVREQWINFSNTALAEVPKGSVQYIESRRVFYAGYLCALMDANNLGHPDVPEVVGTAFLEERLEEVDKFFAELKQGVQ